MHRNRKASRSLTIDPGDPRALLGPAGAAVLAALDPAADPIREGTRLRRDHPAELVAAAQTQYALRERASAKFGAAAGAMYFTDAGLQQASRAEVAAHRAARFAAALDDTGDAPIVDLCCGIGGDLLALAALGRPVAGVDRDGATAALAAANLAALGAADRARVWQGDVRTARTERAAAVFCDPARRGAGRTGSRRIFDPAAYSPALHTAIELAGAAPAGCVKVGPGIAHDRVPAGARSEWVSWRGEVKEAAIWLGRCADGPARTATVLPAGVSISSADEPAGGIPATGAGALGRYLYEPDGAVIRAHLVTAVAAVVSGALLDPRIAYLTSDRRVATPFARGYEIAEVLPFTLKRLRAALRAHDAGTVTVKKRGFAGDVDQLRARLRTSGSRPATVVLTRIGERPYALICHPDHTDTAVKSV